LPTTYDAARYTAGTDMDGAVEEIRFCNKTGSAVTVNLEMYPGGASGSNLILLKDYSLAANSAYVFKGVRVLLEADELHAKAGTASAVDLYVSVGEQDNTVVSNVRQGYVRNVSNGSYDTLYTAAEDMVVNDVLIVNKSGSGAGIDLQLWPLGVSGNAVQLMSSVTVAAGETYCYIGVTNLLDTDVLKVQADATSAFDVILSGVSGGA